MNPIATPIIAMRDTKPTARKAVVVDRPAVLDVASRTSAVRPIVAKMISSTAILTTCIGQDNIMIS